MTELFQYSKRESDLLIDKTLQHPLKFDQLSNEIQKNVTDAPQALNLPMQHQLQKEDSVCPTLKSIIEMRRNLAGNGQAEQFIQELSSAAQFNRGPPGFSKSSRLHFDILLGRDDKIGYGDYLNYENQLI